MTEQQAWEKLYGRRSPDVRVLGRYSAESDGEEYEPERRRSPVARADPESEAHAA
ncbi:MAG: hypothetical protein QOH15_214 [Gaiellales bacterium]|nr:hypothetical protein [Gaiellales bacterium]